MSGSAPINNARDAASILAAAGIVTSDQVRAVREYVQKTGERPEEALLEQGFVNEADLLKYVAAFFKTRFVTTEGLQKAHTPRATLEMIPHRVAETFGVCPVMFAPQENVLSVVTADPDRPDVMKELVLVSGAREIKAFVARPAAVKACIARGYGGDQRAFAFLEREAAGTIAGMYTRDASRGAAGFSSPGDHAPSAGGGMTGSPGSMPSDPMASLIVRSGNAATPRDLGSIDPMPAAQGRTAAPAAAPAVGPVANSTAAPSGSGRAATAAKDDEAARPSVLEILNVMVSLLENTRQELRGHSALVSRLSKRLAERVGLDAKSMMGAAISGHIHDLGKMGRYHLTALNVAEYEGHRVAAQRAVHSPARLLEASRLPTDALAAVASMYERYDGKGFPASLSGKDIPVLARILAITDTYADLTHNTRNPYRKALPPNEAFDILQKYKENVFDPHLTDLFKSLMTGEDLRARLLDARYVALLIDPDPEDTTVLELRMLEVGIDVKVARTADEAVTRLEVGDVDIVLSELDLPGGDGKDGLALLADVRMKPWGKALPWIVYTRRTSHADAQRAFELGVLDFASKLSQEALLVAKVKALLDGRGGQRSSRGVTGSIREMSVPDIVQVLSSGRKSGSLRIRMGAETGEIHLTEGNVVNAIWSKLRGEEAFYAILRLQDGEFALDPTFVAKDKVIDVPSEMLLLEGMRRLDEA